MLDRMALPVSVSVYVFLFTLLLATELGKVSMLWYHNSLGGSGGEGDMS